MRGAARTVWLASYPKSGNTWVRVFLSNLTEGTAAPVDINDLRHSAISASREVLDKTLGFDTADLTREETQALRPQVYRWINAQLKQTAYVKAHDANIRLENGDWLIAPDATARVVYVIRNPLDVAVSLAHFNGYSLDEAIKTMADPAMVLARQTPTRSLSQVEQPGGTWSGHVQSWTDPPADAPMVPRDVVRYEDLQRNPQERFTALAQFLGETTDQKAVAQAIKNAAFKTLQALESEGGFRERPQATERFFRSGKVGEGKNVLSQTQIDRVIHDHGAVMQKFGYLDEDGRLI